MTKMPDIYEQLAADEYWYYPEEMPPVSILSNVVDATDILFTAGQRSVAERFTALRQDSRRMLVDADDVLPTEAPEGSLLRVVVDERYRKPFTPGEPTGTATSPAAFNIGAESQRRNRWYTGQEISLDTGEEIDGMSMRLVRSVAYAVKSYSGNQFLMVASNNVASADPQFADRFRNSLLPTTVRTSTTYTTGNTAGTRDLKVASAELISPLFPRAKIRGEKSPTLLAMLGFRPPSPIKL